MPELASRHSKEIRGPSSQAVNWRLFVEASASADFHEAWPCPPRRLLRITSAVAPSTAVTTRMAGKPLTSNLNEPTLGPCGRPVEGNAPRGVEKRTSELGGAVVRAATVLSLSNLAA